MKKKWMRVLSLILVLTMVFSLVPSALAASYRGNVNGTRRYGEVEEKKVDPEDLPEEPEEEVTEEPEEEVTEEPEEEVTEEPKEETTEEPKEETTEEPKEEVTEEPKEETTEEPKEETTEEPKEETTEEPKEETTEEPKEETTEEPKEETTEEPKEETTEEPKEEVTEEPKEETTEEPKEEVTEEPKEEVTEEPAPAEAVVEEPAEEHVEETKEEPVPSAIVTDPADLRVLVNGEAKFSVETTGEVDHCQWQYSVNGRFWSNLNAFKYGNKTELKFKAAKSDNNLQFRCVVYFKDGTQLVSKSAKLTVVSGYIETQPESATVAPGEKALFSVTVKGSVAGYQWQNSTNGGKNWKNLNGKNYRSASMKLDAAEKLDGTQYRCVVTLRDGTRLTTDAAVLTVAVPVPEVVEPEMPARILNPVKKRGPVVEVGVQVDAPEGALPVDAELNVDPVAEPKKYEQLTKEALGENIEIGYMVDINFTTPSEGEIEPAKDKPVLVYLTVPGLSEHEDFQIVHISDDNEVDVLTPVPEEQLTRPLAENEIAIRTDEFSVFELTWTVGSTEQNATIKWGRNEGGEFVQMDESETVSLDTTGSSISLANSYDGYYYLSAVCYPTAEDEAAGTNGVDIEDTLYKTDDGKWQYKPVATEEVPEPEKADLPDGSVIRVFYYVPSPGQIHVPGADNEDVPSPTTTKNVEDKENGTYDIILDIEGASVSEDKSHYANVMIILDRTISMDETLSGSTSKWDAAIDAIDTLVDTLTTGTNAGNSGKIDFCLVGFGGNYRNGSGGNTVTGNKNETLVAWTKDEGTFKSYVDDELSMLDDTYHGTNWEGGLGQGVSETAANKLPDNDPLFIIFVTDGNPNCTNDLYYNGRRNATTCANAAYDEARTLASRGNLYGFFCGAGTGSTSYNLLNGVICGTGQGGIKTIGASDADTIRSEFRKIAETMLDIMTASNVSVDDGIPSLSSVSSSVAGEAGGFEYYRLYPLTAAESGGGYTYKVGDTTYNVSDADFAAGSSGGNAIIKDKDGKEGAHYIEIPWTSGYPGANYSEANGVTWDLSEVAVVPGIVYRLKFTVWPSQAAYDLLADMNNDLRKLNQLTETEKRQLVVQIGTARYTYNGTNWTSGGTTKTTAELMTEIENAAEGTVTYYIPTNTHLLTTYTFQNQTYTDPPSGELVSEDMILKDTTIDVEKIWHNYLDSRDDEDIDGLQMVLSKDGAEYLEFDVSSPTWKAEDLFISCGVIVDGVVKETGHDYSVSEKPRSENNDKTPYWEVESPNYHPMVVNGQVVLFVEKTQTEYNAAAAADRFTLEKNNKTHYYVKDTTSSSLTAINERVSWLNLIKAPDGMNPDEFFTFKVNIVEADGDDIYFSVRGGGMNYRDDIVVSSNVDTYVETVTKPDGTTEDRTYYVAPSGEDFTLKVKPTWSTRFLNLTSGTTYTITETDIKYYYEFGSATAVETLYKAYREPADGYPKTVNFSANNITGTINQTNTDYTVTVTNKPLYFFVYHSSDNTIEKIEMDDTRIVDGKFNIVDETKAGYLYGGYFKAYGGAGMTDEQIIAATYSSADSKQYTYDDEKTNTTKNWLTDSSGTAYTGSVASQWKNSKAYIDSGITMTPAAGTVYYLKEVPNKYFRPALYYVYDDYSPNKDLKQMYLMIVLDDALYQFVNGKPIDIAQNKRLYTTFKVTKADGSTVLIKATDVNSTIDRGSLAVWDETSKIVADTVYEWTPNFVTKDGVEVTSNVKRTITIGDACFGNASDGHFGTEDVNVGSSYSLYSAS